MIWIKTSTGLGDFLAGRYLDSRTAALSVWGSYVTWKYFPCQNSAEAQPPRSFPRSFPKGEEVME